MTREDGAIRNRETYSALRFQGYDAPQAAEIAASIANDNRAPSAEGRQPSYEAWTRGALERRATTLQIQGHADMPRAELIAALRR